MERLSGLDATFLYLETPSHHMHVAMTMVLDPATIPGGYSFDKLKAFIRSRLHVVPLFHRRLVQVPFRLNHPVWVEDPNFDLDYHVRRIAAPAPGGRRELAALAAQIASTQLDRTKPLWEMWVIEGLKQDRVGIVTKVHHAAVDGASGADFLVHLFDLEPVEVDVNAEANLPTEHLPTDLELVGHAAASLLRRTVTMLPLVGRTAQSVARVVQGRRDPEKMVGAVPLTAPQTPWTAAVTPHRTVGFARVPLAEIKEIKNAFGTTVNDVVLALVAGILRGYLEQKDAMPDTPLLAVCPISVRGGEQPQTASANRVSAMFVSLATDIDSPADRVRAIQQSTKGAKDEHNAVGASMLMEWAEFASPNLFNLASRLYSSMELANRHRAIHNVIISNVPGPNFPLYYAGAEMVAAYPMGPIMEGCGLNITVFSYRDSVDIGIMACRELIPDVWDMAQQAEYALAELLAAARAETGAEASSPAPTNVTPIAAAKSAPTRKAAAPKAAAPKAAAAQAPAKKATPPKAPAKTSATTKSAAAKKAASRSAAATTKSAPAKKSTAKKATPAAKATPAKKATTAKAPAKRASAPKAAAKKAAAKTSAAKKPPTPKASNE